MASLVDDREKMDDLSAFLWLQENRYYKVRKFLETNFNRSVIEEEFEMLLQSPLASYSMIKQSFESNKEKYNLMLDRLSTTGYICVVIGAKGSGKTASITGRIVFDLMRRGCKIAYVGMPQNVPFFLNDDPIVKKNKGLVEFYYDFFSVPTDRIIVQDESAIIDNAKNYQEKAQKEKEDILPILRHKGNSIIYISQQFTIVSKRVRDLTDMFIIKPFNLMQLLKDNDESEFPFPPIIRSMIPKSKNELMFVDGMLGIKLIKHDIEAFYKNNPDVWGKTFKNIENDDEANKFIDALFENNFPPEKVWHLLRLRGYNKPIQFYKNLAKNKNLSYSEKE